MTGATHSSRALGTTVSVVVTNRHQLDDVVARVMVAIDALDRAASRFRDDSDLSQANAVAGSPVRVGPVLRDAVRACLQMASATRGLVDPSVGRELEAAGYDRTFAELPERSGCLVARDPSTRPTWRDVELVSDAAGGWLTVPRGAHLDLGAVAKAWLADVVSVEASARSQGGVLVDLGGDIAVAGEPPEGGWVIALPVGADAQSAVSISSGGVATSAQDVRRWMTRDGSAHHIIDPRTGVPADSPWRAVTVHAATATEANAASTAAIVLAEAAPAWLDAHRLAARLVPLDGTSPVLVGAWPEAATDPALLEA